MENLWLIGLFALSGLVIGSFINVVVYRLPQILLKKYKNQEALSLSLPNSHCPFCQQSLPVKHLIPIISWLFLKGHCYYCRQAISIRYPLTEALCSILFIIIIIYNPISLWCLFLSIITAWLLTLALIDLNCQLLPDILTQPLMWAGLISAYFNISLITLEQSLLGIISGYLLLWLPASLFRLIRGYHGLGGGDIKLMAALGAWINPYLLPYILICACSLAILFFTISYTKPYKIAFGPYIVLTGWLALINNPFII